MTKDETLDLALEALEYIHEGANNQGPHTGISWRCVAVKAEPAIKAIKQARALDKKAENARELGLDYEPEERYTYGTPLLDAFTKPEPVQEPADGTQVSKVWWDGEKLMAKPIPLEDIYQPAPVQEPVATLWQHGETGRTRITMPGDITDCDARWFKAADLYTTPPADGYDKVLQAIKEARPAVAALKDKPVSWWLDRFEELVKQLKEKNT